MELKIAKVPSPRSGGFPAPCRVFFFFRRFFKIAPRPAASPVSLVLDREKKVDG
jgi:hypothetical protein